MAQSVCPKCGAVLVGERPRFCAKCGHGLLETQESASQEGTEAQRHKGTEQTVETPVETQDSASPASVPETASAAPQGVRASEPQETEAIYLTTLQGHLAGGEDLSPEAVQDLNQLAATLGISDTQSGQLMDRAMDSLRPSKTDDMDESPEPRTTKGLILSINLNRFYMAGIDGILDVQLENYSDEVYDEVDVIASGNLLGRTEKWTCSFESCGSRSEMFEVRPERPGSKIIRFFVDARQGQTIRSYDAKCDLPVFADNQDLHDVLQQVSNMGNISAGTGKAMGNSVSNNIHIMVDQGRIKNANDLMLEYSKLAPRFEPIELRHDPKRSEDLTTAWKRRRRTERIVEPERGSLTEAGSLLSQGKDRTTNVLLLAKQRVTLGKNRSNDIVARVCPRSAGNDYQSNQMSREHCVIELSGHGVQVKDSGSANGTFVDGRKVDADGVRITQSGRELDLAGVLKFTVRIIGPRRENGQERQHQEMRGQETHGQETQNLASLRGGAGPLWEPAGRAKVDSLVLQRTSNLGPEDANGCERYCVVYRLATIGSDEQCALSVAEKGLDPVHAAIVYLRDRFYLENLSELANVIVNDRTLSRSELMPLSFGDQIRIGRLEAEFRQACQMFL